MYHDLPIKNGGSFVDLSIAILTSPEANWVAHSIAMLRTRMRSGNAMASALERIRSGVAAWEWTDARSTRHRWWGGIFGGWEGGFYITFKDIYYTFKYQ